MNKKSVLSKVLKKFLAIALSLQAFLAYGENSLENNTYLNESSGTNFRKVSLYNEILEIYEGPTSNAVCYDSSDHCIMIDKYKLQSYANKTSLYSLVASSSLLTLSTFILIASMSGVIVPAALFGVQLFGIAAVIYFAFKDYRMYKFKKALYYALDVESFNILEIYIEDLLELEIISRVPRSELALN